MEQSKNRPELLFTFRCTGSTMHRTYRESKNNASRCSQCQKPMEMIASTTRKDGESIEQFHVRVLTAKKQLVN